MHHHGGDVSRGKAIFFRQQMPALTIKARQAVRSRHPHDAVCVEGHHVEISVGWYTRKIDALKVKSSSTDRRRASEEAARASNPESLISIDGHRVDLLQSEAGGYSIATQKLTFGVKAHDTSRRGAGKYFT